MARGYNKAILIGNLARDPEVRYTANNTAVASTAIAVNRSWRGQNGEQREEVDFIPIVLWGKLAEFSERYLKKG
ncbi:MAG: single-stranded DNA-binding protein, partial [Pyramidobacter sp.]|nr:single-stranded DNA-binding protein [Pyramidobacter sp.]